MDPQAGSDGFVTSFDMNMYEPLLIRDLKLVLATEWSNTDPTTWRFKPRHDVTFHDGTPMTADDGVFSMPRAEVAMRTMLVKNPNWWGLNNQPIDLDEVVFNRFAITSGSIRP